MFLLVLACVLHGAFADPALSRIVGGQNASKGQFPYQVSVRDRSIPNNFNHYCGGVIIGVQDVLTAAQCVRDKKISDVYIVAGTISLSVQDDATAVVVKAAKIKIHPAYNAEKTYNDLAIIRLAAPLPDRPDVKPAALLHDAPARGTACTVSGWGLTNGSAVHEKLPRKLLTATVRLILNTECRERVSVHEDEVCAEPTANKAEGPCDLDNGGPLFCGAGLLGIYSWSETYCGTPDSPGVYSSVPYHYDWIKSVQATTTPRGHQTSTPKGPRSTSPKSGTTPKPEAKEPSTWFILAIIQIILLIAVLLLMFVLIAVASRRRREVV